LRALQAAEISTSETNFGVTANIESGPNTDLLPSLEWTSGSAGFNGPLIGDCDQEQRMSVSNRGLPKETVPGGMAQKRGRLSLRRLSAYIGASFGALALFAGLLLILFDGVVLNRYGKGKAERGFAVAHPGCALHIGALRYTASVNRLVAESVTLSTTNTLVKTGRISMTGIRWARFLWGKAALADVLAKASFDATNLHVELIQEGYVIRCAQLRASVPGAELIAEGTEFQPLEGDETFFAAHAFREARFRVVLPECRVLGLAYGDLLQGKSYRAGSVHFSNPSFDALINRDKPPGPFVKSPLMVQEALGSIRQPFEIGTLSITNGQARYCERQAIGAEAAVLTIGDVSLSAEGIANRGDATAAVHVRWCGELMNAGTMNLRMSIPIHSPNFSLHYSGSLGAMDLTRINAFLDIAEHTHIKSGTAQASAFEIDVAAGHATGHVSATYKDLEIAVLDKQTGDQKGPANRVASFFANLLKIRSANPPEGSASRKEGKVDYARRPGDEFQQFVWFALRTGVLDIISQ